MILPAACDRQPTGSDVRDSGLRPVLVEPVERGRFSVERRFVGVVRSRSSLEVAVREPGEVVVVTAPPDSQPVAAGALLFELSSPDLELELAEARSQLRHAHLGWERSLRLAEMGLVSQTEVDASQATLDQARIRLDRLELRRALLEVTAPAAGLYLEITSPEPGQWLAAGHELGRIVDPAALEVEVVVPDGWSSTAARVRQAVLELGDQGEAAAEVVALSADVDAARGGRVLTLRPSPGVELAADATLAVRLVVTERPDAVTVPVGAVVQDGEGGWKVAVGPAAGARGRLRWVAVVPGPSDGYRTVIDEGLDAEQWVVVVSELDDIPFWDRSTFLGVGR
jgi:RND family efflux transporter MFP subunit